MTRRRFYLFSLWLPLIMPLIVCIIGIISEFLQYWLQYTPHNTEGMLGDIVGLIFFSTLFGGVQYILFAVAVAFWFKGKEARFIAGASWTLPLLFAPVCVLGIWLVLGDDRGTWNGYSGFLGIAIVFGKVSVIFGYAYVLLAHALAFILAKVKIIKG